MCSTQGLPERIGMSVDEKTVRNWIQRGDLRAVNIGRVRPEYRIRPADLDEYMENRQTDK